jgi:hypothetical protein
LSIVDGMDAVIVATGTDIISLGYAEKILHVLASWIVNFALAMFVLLQLTEMFPQLQVMETMEIAMEY